MRVLTDEHWSALKEHLRLSGDPKDILVELAMHTGARVSEILGLTRSNFRGDKVHIKGTKGSMDRTVHINEDLMTKVKLLDLGPKDTIVSLCTKASNLNTQRRILHRHISEMTNWLLGETYSMHTLRHTILTLLYRKSGDIYLVKQWAGHRAISSTLQYMHHCQKEKADMMVSELMNEVI